ncbi:MAG TPA: toxin glutamine deamidase domain-containing protein [Puia sp.]|uniref:toxin glutamine deamidase domain-containing protein n=1 Tax=Puia sp. TaxID=2045100 RepID=UPI002BB79D6A|nr:toxin glutamine deamidase domain-containing protein [Puia sp.]HVU95793.1 toxin glutamine deamidase domain-containing protein [Puia sp.]
MYSLPLLKGREVPGVNAEVSLRGGSRDVNPLRGQDNCAGCTIAGDASLKGHPASAINHGVTYVSDFMKEFGATQMSIYKSPQAIANFMGNLNEGATGVIFGDRGPGVDGHFFNVAKQSGVVQFIDFQQPVGYRFMNPSTIMQEGGFKQLYFLNTTKTT